MQLMDTKKTGANVALDGTEDHMIVREAGEFFRRLNVREKLAKEIAIVRHEARAGRLTWNYEDVQKTDTIVSQEEG